MPKKTIIEIGWKKLDCGHIVPLPYEDTPCPTCAEIKAAREEVLELAKLTINAQIKMRCDMKKKLVRLTATGDRVTELRAALDQICSNYQLKFGS